MAYLIMDVTSAFFPSIYKHYKSQHACRNYFLQYGSHLNVDIDDELALDSGVVVCAQKTWARQRLGICTPSLPLASEPEHVTYPFHDNISNEVRETQDLVNTLINKVQVNSGRLNAASSNQYHLNMMEVGHQLSQNKMTKSGLKDCSPWHLVTLQTVYSNLQSDSKFARVNSVFTGGSLCCMMVSGKIYLIHARGEHRDTLCILEVCRTGDGVLQEQLLHEVPLGTAALEIRTSYYESTGFCCVRAERGYSLYQIASNGCMVEPLCIYNNLNFEINVTSICLSPYIPGEVLISNSTGCAHLIHPPENNATATNSTVMKTLITKGAHRFPVTDSWRQCHWGAHPRQVILADRTCVRLFDSRTKHGEGVDLFAQPNRLLQQEERVMVMEPHPEVPYLHFIATDFTLMVLDQRLPLNPVMLLPNTLTCTPKYLAPLTQDNGSMLVLLASQLPPAETHCYRLQYGGQQSVKLAGPSWRLSEIRESVKQSSVFVDPSLLQQRMNTSLAGVTGCQHEENVYNFQLNTYGEVFYQTLRREDTDNIRDIHESTEEPLPESVKTVLDTWLSKLNIIIEQMESPANYISPIDVSNKLADLCPNPHVLCPLCMPVTQSTKITTPPPQVQKDNPIRCNSCYHSLQLANYMSQYADQGVVYKSSSQHTQLLDKSVLPLADLPQSTANTQLLLKLWQEDSDVRELVLARNKERQCLQERRQQQKIIQHIARHSRLEQISEMDQILAEHGPSLVTCQYSEQCTDDSQENVSNWESLCASKKENLPSGGSKNEQEKAVWDGESVEGLSLVSSHSRQHQTHFPGFSSTPTRLRTHESTMTSASTLLTLSDEDDDKYFLQENLEMFSSPSSALFQETVISPKLKPVQRISSQSEKSLHSKKKRIVPGF